MTAAERVLAHFDRISEAPDAIPRLRCFVLDLAVRGKLVDQNPNDEPTADLLTRIRAEKTQTAGLGGANAKAKGRASPVSDRDNEAEPFVVPAGWCWSSLSQIGHISPRNVASDTHPASFVPMTLVSADYGIPSQHEPRPWGEIKSGYTHFANGDVALAKITPCFENGKSTVFRNLTGGIGAGTTELHVVRPILMDPDYILIFLKSPSFIDRGIPKMTGTAGQKRVSADYFALSPFPLPPVAEQYRIVAKVDELMALCDRLEAAQKERESRRDRLVSASQARLSQPADSPSFPDHSRFHLEHLPCMITSPAHVQQLRHTILELGIRGLLTRHEVTDDSAIGLLERIRSEKDRLASSGEIKKDKNTWEGLPKEPPYELQEGWVWTTLQDVFEISRGGSPRPAGDPRYFGGPIPWITVREVTKDSQKYLTSTEAGLTEQGAKRSRFIDVGDLLLTNSGATLGVPKVSCIRGCINDGVAVLRLFHSVPLNDFAYLYLHSQTESFRAVNQGMGQPNLNTGIIAGWFFPLPSLAEQRRIVTKVDELMAVCDRLEAQLKVGRVAQGALLEATLRDVLTGPEPAPMIATE